jgi:small subunit ribosomal protein S20
LANNKSALKRIKTSAVRTARNRRIKSTVKTAIKNLQETVAKSPEEARESLVKAQKTLDKAVSKGVLHKNNAARKKSRLAKKVNAL